MNHALNEFAQARLRTGPRWVPPKGPLTIERTCNRCYETFYTDSKFLRSCDPCKAREDWADGNDYLMAHLV